MPLRATGLLPGLVDLHDPLFSLCVLALGCMSEFTCLLLRSGNHHLPALYLPLRVGTQHPKPRLPNAPPPQCQGPSSGHTKTGQVLGLCGVPGSVVRPKLGGWRLRAPQWEDRRSAFQPPQPLAPMHTVVGRTPISHVSSGRLLCWSSRVMTVLIPKAVCLLGDPTDHVQGMGWDQGPSGGARGGGWGRLPPKCSLLWYVMPSEAGTEFLAASSHPSGPRLAGVRGTSLAVSWNGRTHKKGASDSSQPGSWSHFHMISSHLFAS